ncbi:MAG: NADH-quinone oxidoreductase subunit A [Phycisphaerae bacterium]|jgi:NADH-quinone oxidoreductase subunit A
MWCGLTLAAADFATIGVLVVVAIGMALGMMVAAHVLGPRRHGPIKDDTYESGLTPITDARRRFNVRFYLVAVMYVVFGVEVVFLYPWAQVFPGLREGLTASEAGQTSATAQWAADLAQRGYGPGYMLVVALIFLGVLTVGLIYEWRKGIFRWD